MRLYTVLRNLAKKIINNLQEAKNYADAGLATKLTSSDFKFDTLQTSVTVGGGSTAWGSVTVPNDRILLAPVGIYWFGTNNINVTNYAYRKASDNSIQFALRNWGSASAPLTVDIQYLYLDIGGVTRKLIGWLLPLGKVVAA